MFNSTFVWKILLHGFPGWWIRIFFLFFCSCELLKMLEKFLIFWHFFSVTVNGKNSRGFYRCDSWNESILFLLNSISLSASVDIQKEIVLRHFLEFFPLFVLVTFFRWHIFEGKFKWWNKRIKQNDRELKGCG